MTNSIQSESSRPVPLRRLVQSGDELRALAGIMNDIMPALDRMQERSPQPELGHLPSVSIETVAAVAFVSDVVFDSLRRLAAYIEANSARFPSVDDCAPFVATAARAMAARDFAQAFTSLYEAYRFVSVLRLDEPGLPPLASANWTDGQFGSASGFGQSEQSH